MIRIIANGHQLDFVKETLMLKDDNNAVSLDFKVTHNSYPFLIVENEACLLGLGTRDIASVHKKKVVAVTVYEGENQYYGELQVMSYLSGYRKCNLKYATELLTVFAKKISQFMPVVSVIPGETDPIPYTIEGSSVLPGSIDWLTYPSGFIDKSFPEVKWQFPLMNWNKKFGEDLEETDPWFPFRNIVNNFNFPEDPPFAPETFLVNGFEYEEDPVSFDIYNYNVASPQVYLLSPLFYVLQSIGFKAGGDFVESSFVKKILMFSDEDNMIKTYPAVGNVAKFFGGSSEITGMFFWGIYYTPTMAGRYVFHYSFTEPNYAPISGKINQKYLTIHSEASYNVIKRFLHLPNTGSKTYTGSVEIIVDESMVGQEIKIRYFSPANTLPTYYVEMEQQSYLPLMQMHPTIETGRYVPDWSFGEYLNQLKKMFGLDIEIDDFKKQVSLNFVEDFIRSETKFISPKSLKISSYDPEDNTAYHLKYSNDEDASLFITKAGPELYTGQVNSFTQDLESKFKFMPVIGNQLNITDDMANKEGVGLLIYDPAFLPFPSESYEGRVLSLEGEMGIYETCHKLFVKAMLGGSLLEASGPFDAYEVSKIRRLKKISLDHQSYIIQSTQANQVSENIFMVKMRLISVNY